MPIHPARFPAQLPEYFIRFLTDPGDVVLGPFGGWCVTGAVAEGLGREWTCCELDAAYLDGAKARFPIPPPDPVRHPASYEISAPCAIDVDESATRLLADSGRQRPLPRLPEPQPARTTPASDRSALAE